MKITRIEREIRHKIFLGGFETIEPCLRISADLEEGDDPQEAIKEIDKAIVPMWVKEVLSEIRLTLKRRGDHIPENDKLPLVMAGFKTLDAPK